MEHTLTKREQLMLNAYQQQLTVYKDISQLQILSKETVAKEKIKATTLYDNQRTYEARFFGFVFLVNSLV